MKSYWIQRTKKKQYPTICEDMHTNVVIIGAGLTGLTCAYYLSKSIQDIILVEANSVCYGASGRNTGKVSAQHGLLYHKLIENYDIAMAKQYYHANMEAIRSIGCIIKEHQIDCDFKRSDAALYTNDETLIPLLQDEYQAYLDMEVPCSYEDTIQSDFPAKVILSMHEQARFDPYRYGLGLSDVLDKRGISIYENSNVKTMITKEDSTFEIIVNNHVIRANKVIFASQFPFIDHGHLFFTKMYCEQESLAYMSNTQNVLEYMLVNIEKPLHTYNIYDDKIIVGGNSYKSGQSPEITHTRFMNDIHKIFPKENVEYVWSSQDYITFDHMPFIGKLDENNPNVLFASGYNKWGNTTSNLAGKLLAAYVLDLRSQYHMLFSPQRLSSLFTIPYVKENLNVVYEFIRSKFQVSNDEYPSLGEGKCMIIDGHRYGVYRDDDEQLYIVDITCPHLGCVCSFNSVDKTWDCPCHGSRFSFKGEIIKGPATYRLMPYGEGLNHIDPHVTK